MGEAEEQLLQRVLADLYVLCETTEEMFQQSLHQHCQDNKKLERIQRVSKFGQQQQIIMFG